MDKKKVKEIELDRLRKLILLAEEERDDLALKNYRKEYHALLQNGVDLGIKVKALTYKDISRLEEYLKDWMKDKDVCNISYGKDNTVFIIYR